MDPTTRFGVGGPSSLAAATSTSSRPEASRPPSPRCWRASRGRGRGPASRRLPSQGNEHRHRGRRRIPGRRVPARLPDAGALAPRVHPAAEAAPDRSSVPGVRPLEQTPPRAASAAPPPEPVSVDFDPHRSRSRGSKGTKTIRPERRGEPCARGGACSRQDVAARGLDPRRRTARAGGSPPCRVRP